VLGSSEPGGPGLLFAPAFEAPHPCSQGEQASVRVVREFHSYHDIIVVR
jgi:hypothetical protein